MKKYIITSILLIFMFFGIGSGVTVYYLTKTTSNLRYLINLHEIEDIRQALSFNFQKVQNYTFSSPDYFADHLDEIIASAERVNETAARCHECHHPPEIKAELDDVTAQILDYQEQLSYLITAVVEDEHRSELQLEVLEQSNGILNQVQDMVSRATNTLNIKTDQAMHKIDITYKILALTLLLTFVAALIVAQFLVRHITKPLHELKTAAAEIAQGKPGHQAEITGGEEFRQLIDTFNSMSTSLARQENTILSSLEKLNTLNRVTMQLHGLKDMHNLLQHLNSSIHELINVKHTGILLPEEESSNFSLYLFDTAADKTEGEPLLLSGSEVLHAFNKAADKSLLVNDTQYETDLPFAGQLPGIKVDNILLSWMLSQNTVSGALIGINREDRNLTEEDSIILDILAENTKAAFENLRLLKEDQSHLLELKKTQQQLLKAEKHTVLGALAGGVAHDFNNILCGMIGYVSLLKKNQDPEGRDFKMLDTIEKAGFRAANLTRQLLTFSHQESTDLSPIDVNIHIENVVKLLENTISKHISIKFEPGISLPKVLSDPAQLEQIIMNLCINARDAMPSGGQILVRSELANVDQKFCEDQPEARPGTFIKVEVSDAGQGIDEEVLVHIFDPFFTTKEFGKGLGLGLAMVYSIIKSHKGFIAVSSSPGHGTTFSVFLPEAVPDQDEEVQQEISDQMLRANILIVDDEELVASMLTEHLQSLGCRTYHARNGEEALASVSQHKDELDVVILDINMPVLDGKTVYERIIELKPDLKVLVASGYSMNNAAKELLSKGADGFLQKPYSLENITAKIKQIIND